LILPGQAVIQTLLDLLAHRQGGIRYWRDRYRLDMLEVALLSQNSRHARTDLSGLAGGDKGSDNLPVVTRADKTLQSGKRSFQIHRALIRPLGGHRVKSIGDCDDARLHRNLIALQTARVT